jgi:hypothetical protein
LRQHCRDGEKKEQADEADELHDASDKSALPGSEDQCVLLFRQGPSYCTTKVKFVLCVKLVEPAVNAPVTVKL